MRFALVLVLAALTGLAAVPGARAAPPVVVELFTSQGCNTCPPADRFFGELAEEPGVIALGFHVDYWDYLGWADTFARPAFTARQDAYAGRADRSGIKGRLRGKFTPEMVVQGTHSLVGHDRPGVTRAILAHAETARRVALDLSREGGTVTVACRAEADGLGELRVVLARVMPEAEVEITRGENAGKTLTYHRIVTDLVEIARWSAQGQRSFTFEADGPVVILLQQGEAGPIVAAAELR